MPMSDLSGIKNQKVANFPAVANPQHLHFSAPQAPRTPWPTRAREAQPGRTDATRADLVPVRHLQVMIKKRRAATSGRHWLLKYRIMASIGTSTFALLPGRLSPLSQQGQSGQNSRAPP